MGIKSAAARGGEGWSVDIGKRGSLPAWGVNVEEGLNNHAMGDNGGVFFGASASA